MKALSLDLRQRIADAIAQNTLDTYQHIAQRFAVSVATVERLAKKKRLGHGLTPGESTGRKPKVPPEQYPDFERLAASRTDWTLRTLADAWQKQGGELLSEATTSRTLQRLGFSFKKSAGWLPNVTKNSAKPSERK